MNIIPVVAIPAMTVDLTIPLIVIGCLMVISLHRYRFAYRNSLSRFRIGLYFFLVGAGTLAAMSLFFKDRSPGWNHWLLSALPLLLLLHTLWCVLDFLAISAKWRSLRAKAHMWATSAHMGTRPFPEVVDQIQEALRTERRWVSHRDIVRALSRAGYPVPKTPKGSRQGQAAQMQQAMPKQEPLAAYEYSQIIP
jgi:hypothetical protein